MGLTRPKIGGTISKENVLRLHVNRLGPGANFGGTADYKVDEVQQDDSVVSKEKNVEVVWTGADKTVLAQLFPTVKAAIAAKEGVEEEAE